MADTHCHQDVEKLSAWGHLHHGLIIHTQPSSAVVHHYYAWWRACKACTKSRWHCTRQISNCLRCTKRGFQCTYLPSRRVPEVTATSSSSPAANPAIQDGTASDVSLASTITYSDASALRATKDLLANEADLGSGFDHL
ncbi:hypothetical protein F5Y16DRAFT_240499 [Xylariaceae sp. FL0255]|nr:hypothetical protein F5Y16DRAFT_240499 [Xylariaceae sp. FL0255]